MRWLGLAAFALWAGCNHEPLAPDNSDGNTFPDAAQLAGSDGGAAPDGGLCTTHVYETVAIDMFQPVYFVYHQYQTVQVTLMVPLSAGCDIQGPIDVTYSPGNETDFVKVVAHRWREVGGACPAPLRTPYVLALDSTKLGNLMISISDGSPNATATPILLQLMPGTSDCGPLVNHVCVADCQCENEVGAGSRCLNGTCHVPCNSDSDCAADANEPACNTLEGAPFACGPAFNCPMTCPFGQACDGSMVCRPQPHQVWCGARCSCDSDCGSGGICGGGQCLAPCAVSTDCAGGAGCDPNGGNCSEACGG